MIFSPGISRRHSERQCHGRVSSMAGGRAGDLCRMAGQDKMSFKLNVRKLKTLGLTESLEVGYRLSPRGMALLDELRRRG